MSSSIISRILVASSILSALAFMAPTAAVAREGAQSTGKGMKCYTAAVSNPDGTVTYTQVCYKSI